MSICKIDTCGSENAIREYDAHFATVWLDGTHLSGTIPDSLGHLIALTRLGLQNTRISGTIPDSFCLLTALTHMDLGRTTLSGTIPDSLSSLTALTGLKLCEYMQYRYLFI